MQLVLSRHNCECYIPIERLMAVSSVRYPNACGLGSDEGSRRTAKCNLVESTGRHWTLLLRDREEHVFLILTLLIGALVGMTVVAFILLTERFGARLYPSGGAAWRRLLVPVVGSLGMGFLLYRFFPDARGSGVPQNESSFVC